MGRISILSAALVLSSAVAARGATYSVTTLPLSSTTTTYVGATGAGVTGASEGGYVTTGDGSLHAAQWNVGSLTLTDLNPVGASQSYINAVSTLAQVGVVTNQTGDHPAVWSGGTNTLLPEGTFSGGGATGVVSNFAVNTIVGFGYTDSAQDNTHAALWTGSAGSYTLTDIHPSDPTYVSSSARATDGTTIVGAVGDSSQVQQAALWKVSSPTSTFSLLAGGFSTSVAWGVSGDQIVGFGNTGDGQHATLWTSGGTVATDLQGTGLPGDFSIAYATNGVNQVGSITDTSGDILPYVWSGSATSATPLPLPFATTTSEALAIDSAGDIVGYAVDGTGTSFAVLWRPTLSTPEPGTLGALAIGALAVLRRRKA